MKDHPAFKTLLHPFQQGILSFGGRVLFLNGRVLPELAGFEQSDWVFQQHFKPYLDALMQAGYAACSDAPDDVDAFDTVLLLAPKNRIEAHYMIAQGLRALKSGGLLVVAAENKAGGGRLVQHCKDFGLDDVSSDSRNKSRVVWARVDEYDLGAVEDALCVGGMQEILDGAYQSQPGIFGWNKIDAGSQILLEHLPLQPINPAKCAFKGHGADFGCGYGVLSRYVLTHYAPKSLRCVDADMRSVQACQENLKQTRTAADLHFDHVNLAGDTVPFKNLDFIVMNPPFHEGRAKDTTIAAMFIRNAAAALTRTGVLWMVANKQLPYEPILAAHFFKVEKIVERGGFKVFRAVK